MRLGRHAVFTLAVCACLFNVFPSRSAAQDTRGLSAKARSIVGDEPIIPGPAYPTVLSLPGSPFHRASYTTANIVEQLAHSSTGVVKLPPGDYSIPIRLLCTSVHIANTQHGLSYHMVPLEGKRAPILIPLLSRAPAAHVQFQPLQTLVWQIEAGLTYNQLPGQSRQLVDQLIPEYRNRLNDDFVTDLQKKCNALGAIKGILGQVFNHPGPGSCPQEVETMIQQYQAVRQSLLRESNNFDALSREIVNILPGEMQNTSPTMWSKLNPRVYGRISGGHIYGEKATLELRVLPGNRSSADSQLGKATLARAAFQIAENGAAPAIEGDDGVVVPIETLLGYPTDASLLQALGWVLDTDCQEAPECSKAFTYSGVTPDQCNACSAYAPILGLVVFPYPSSIYPGLFDVAIQVQACNGNALSNKTVTLSVVQGTGSLGSSTLTTNAQGIASTTLTVTPEPQQQTPPACQEVTTGWCHSISFNPITIEATAGCAVNPTTAEVSIAPPGQMLSIGRLSWASIPRAPVTYGVGYAKNVAPKTPQTMQGTICNKVLPLAGTLSACAITAANASCLSAVACPVALSLDEIDPTSAASCVLGLLNGPSLPIPPTDPAGVIQKGADLICDATLPQKIIIAPQPATSNGAQSVQVCALDQLGNAVTANVLRLTT